MDIKKNAKIVLGVLVGNMILSIAVAAFVVPHGIIMGGATGIGLAITHYIPINLSIIILIINAVFFALGACTLGKKFALTTIISTFAYPIFLALAQKIPGIANLTDNMLLATIYAGLLLGIGIGLVVRQGASTGGTDIVALVLNKFFHSPVAVFMYVVDSTVLGSQIFFSDSEQILYGVLALILMTMVLNSVVVFGQSQVQLFVISEKFEEIRKKLLMDMDVGATMIHLETGYSQVQQKGVLCIVPNRKLYMANQTIRSIDDEAFVTISKIKEVKGRGFSLERVQKDHLGS